MESLNTVRRFLSQPRCLWSVTGIVFFLMLALMGPLFSPHGFDDIDWDAVNMSPSWAQGFYFGTDANGRDLFVRTCLGMKISFQVACVASGVSLVIGVVYGALAGYIGGRIDSLMMRAVDVLYALPSMFLFVLMTVCFGNNLVMIFFAIGALEWLDMARIVRGQTLSLKHRGFVEASRSMGASNPYVIGKHIIPNMQGAIVVFLTLSIPRIVLLESALSFLGLGVSEPMASLGSLVSEGAEQLEYAWWAVLFPGGILSFFLLCLNFLGDGLQDFLMTKRHHR